MEMFCNGMALSARCAGFHMIITRSSETFIARPVAGSCDFQLDLL